MKNLKYLNGVLTVIAVCLVLLTLSAVGVIPKANASIASRYATVPLNPDGSINVKIESQGVQPVDIISIGGSNINAMYNDGQRYTKGLPVIVIHKP